MSDRHPLAPGARSVRHARAGASALPLALAVLVVLPFRASPFLLDLANQVLLACIGALALMLLTGFAGLISLGTAGLLGAGAYTVGMLVREVGAPFWITLPAAAVVGAVLGLIFRPAVVAAARPLSRHQHARAAFRRRLSGRRIRGARGAVDRRHDRLAVASAASR